MGDILGGLPCEEMSPECLQEIGIVTEMTVYLSQNRGVNGKKEIGAILT